MKIERINENKVKVTVSVEDLLERNIEVDSLNYNSRETQELFWDMMKKAEVEFGFSTSDAQLCVEASPNNLEGFVIIITRVEDEVDEAFESIQKYIRNKYKKTELKSKKRPRKICSPFAIYSFSQMEDLKLLCARLQRHYNGDSTLYRHKDNYYMILAKSGCSQFSSTEAIIQEYGMKILYTNYFEGFLEEYGKKICNQNAIDVILNYY